MSNSQLDLMARLGALERVTSLILPAALPLDFDVEAWSRNAKSDFANVEPPDLRAAVEQELQKWIGVMRAFRPKQQ